MKRIIPAGGSFTLQKLHQACRSAAREPPEMPISRITTLPRAVLSSLERAR